MGLLGALFGGGGGTTKIGKKAVKDLWERSQAVADMPFQPYEAPRVADLSSTTQMGIGLAKSAVNAGAGAINSAINLAKTTGAYTPQMVSAQTINPALMGSTALNPVSAVTGAQVAPTADVTGVDRSLLGTVGARSFTDFNINDYMNPYLSQVAGATMNDLAFQREQQRGVDNSRAVSAGAFGGSRQAVVDAQTNDMFSRTAATTLSDLYARGFDTASGLITGDANRMLSADQSNLNAGITTAGLDQSAKLANQQVQYGTATANAGYDQAARMANQGMDYNTSLENARLAAAREQTNAGAMNTIATTNASNALDALKSNQTAGLEGNQQRIASGGLLGDLGGSQAQHALNAAKAVTEAGQLETQNAQMKLDADFQEFLRKQGYPVSMIQMLQGSAGIAAGTQTNTSGGIIPGFASLIGAANKPGS